MQSDSLKHLGRIVRGISGGDGDLPDIPELPESLDDLDEQGILDLNSSLQGAYDARRPHARSEDHVNELRSIRDAQKRLAETVRGRREAARALDGLDEDSPTFPEMAAQDADVPADSPADAAAAEADAPAEVSEAADTAEGGEVVPAEGSPVPAGVSASAAADAALAGGEFGGGGAPPARPRPMAPLRAAAGQQAVSVGDDLSDMATFARIVGDTIGSTLPGPDGRSMRAYVASIQAFEDMQGVEIEPLSRRHGPEKNRDLMDEAVAAWKARLPVEYGGTPDARTAAICDPLDIIREIPDCVTAAEPFQDSLPSRPAGRLGFQFMPSASLADAAAGVTVWDEVTDQANVDPTNPATWKPCVFIECPSVEDVRAEAISACVYFDITTEMSSPERVQDIMSKVAAVKARVSEQRLLALASQFTHNYSHTGTYGLVPESIRAVLTTLEQGWATERIDDATLYQWYVPREMLAAWVVDLVGQAFDTQDIDDVVAYIERKFRAAGKNVRIIPLLDVSTFPALPPLDAADTPLSEGMRAGAYETWLLPPEGILFFSTGEIATGVERSPELMRRNQAQWFMEVFHGLTKHGCQPWYRLNVTGCETGTRAALTEPWVCSGGAT